MKSRSVEHVAAEAKESLVGAVKAAGAFGGLLGGAAATGVVARASGYQVVFTPQTVLVFTVHEGIAMR